MIYLTEKVYNLDFLVAKYFTTYSVRLSVGNAMEYIWLSLLQFKIDGWFFWKIPYTKKVYFIIYLIYQSVSNTPKIYILSIFKSWLWALNIHDLNSNSHHRSSVCYHWATTPPLKQTNSYPSLPLVHLSISEQP